MPPENMERSAQGEIAVTRMLDRLIERICDEDEAEEAQATLKRIANQCAGEFRQGLDALIYYRGMRAALNEDDFRWGALQVSAPEERNRLRRERLNQYQRHLELFELEMKLARKTYRSSLALSGNWSRLEEEFREGMVIAKERLILRCAGLLYRFNLPGAMDLCDAAAFELFSLFYLRPFPAA
jgi:hypothetical protein